MIEAVYKKGFYITGTVREVRRRLREHVRKYRTVVELLKNLSP